MEPVARESEPPAPQVEGPLLSSRDALLLSQQLAEFTEGSLPMPEGLRALAEELPGREIRRYALDLADRLEQGESLDGALIALERRLPLHIQELLVASVRSNRATKVLGEFVATKLQSADLHRTVALGLSYPLILLALVSIMFAIVYAVLVPQFQVLFDGFNMTVPWITRAMLDISLSFRQVVEGAVWNVLAGVVMIALAWRFMLDRRSRRWVICHIPLLGALWRWVALSEYCRYLALLLETEVPTARAITLAARATNDAELDYETGHMARDLEHGSTLAEAMAHARVFPPGVAELIRWAEGRESLVDSLRILAEILAEQAKTRAYLVSTMTRVLVVVVLLWGVTFTVLGLMLPLVRLIHMLSG